MKRNFGKGCGDRMNSLRVKFQRYTTLIRNDQEKGGSNFKAETDILLCFFNPRFFEVVAREV